MLIQNSPHALHEKRIGPPPKLLHAKGMLESNRQEKLKQPRTELAVVRQPFPKQVAASPVKGENSLLPTEAVEKHARTSRQFGSRVLRLNDLSYSQQQALTGYKQNSFSEPVAEIVGVDLYV